MPSTPATRPAGPVYSSQPSETVNLWPRSASTEPVGGEIVIDNGKDGHPDRHLSHIINPRIEVFLPPHSDANRPACIICPGGGYALLAVDHEGYQIADMFNRQGVAAFVLMYRLPDGSTPAPGADPRPIQDVHRAIRIVRANAAEWNIDPKRIGVMGFSAGGHVASTAATQFDAGNPGAADPIERQSSRPDFAMLMYPVISMHDPIAHVGSRENLLGKDASNQLMDRFSADHNVTKRTPPLFIEHSEDDTVVPVQNSLQMAAAAARAHVSCELVLFKTGGHGYGMGKDGGEVTAWPGQCIQWMRGAGILSQR